MFLPPSGLPASTGYFAPGSSATGVGSQESPGEKALTAFGGQLAYLLVSAPTEGENAALFSQYGQKIIDSKERWLGPLISNSSSVEACIRKYQKPFASLAAPSPLQGWMPLTKSLWIYVDEKKKEFVFFDFSSTNPFSSESYLSNFVDAKGQMHTKVVQSRAVPYRIRNMERLHSPLLIKLLADGAIAEEKLQDSIIDFLDLKPLPIPTPEKMPHWYVPVDKIMPPWAREELNIGLFWSIILEKSHALSPKQADQLRWRVHYLEVFEKFKDSTIDQNERKLMRGWLCFYGDALRTEGVLTQAEAGDLVVAVEKFDKEVSQALTISAPVAFEEVGQEGTVDPGSLQVFEEMRTGGQVPLSASAAAQAPQTSPSYSGYDSLDKACDRQTGISRLLPPLPCEPARTADEGLENLASLEGRLLCAYSLSGTDPDQFKVHVEEILEKAILQLPLSESAFFTEEPTQKTLEYIEKAFKFYEELFPLLKNYAPEKIGIDDALHSTALAFFTCLTATAVRVGLTPNSALNPQMVRAIESSLFLKNPEVAKKVDQILHSSAPEAPVQTLEQAFLSCRAAYLRAVNDTRLQPSMNKAWNEVAEAHVRYEQAQKAKAWLDGQRERCQSAYADYLEKIRPHRERLDKIEAESRIFTNVSWLGVVSDLKSHLEGKNDDPLYQELLQKIGGQLNGLEDRDPVPQNLRQFINQKVKLLEKEHFEETRALDETSKQAEEVRDKVYGEVAARLTPLIGGTLFGVRSTSLVEVVRKLAKGQAKEWDSLLQEWFGVETIGALFLPGGAGGQQRREQFIRNLQYCEVPSDLPPLPKRDDKVNAWFLGMPEGREKVESCFSPKEALANQATILLFGLEKKITVNFYSSLNLYSSFYSILAPAQYDTSTLVTKGVMAWVNTPPFKKPVTIRSDWKEVQSATANEAVEAYRTLDKRWWFLKQDQKQGAGFCGREAVASTTRGSRPVEELSAFLRAPLVADSSNPQFQSGPAELLKEVKKVKHSLLKGAFRRGELKALFEAELRGENDLISAAATQFHSTVRFLLTQAKSDHVDREDRLEALKMLGEVLETEVIFRNFLESAMEARLSEPLVQEILEKFPDFFAVYEELIPLIGALKSSSTFTSVGGTFFRSLEVYSQQDSSKILGKDAIYPWIATLWNQQFPLFFDRERCMHYLIMQGVKPSFAYALSNQVDAKKAQQSLIWVYAQRRSDVPLRCKRDDIDLEKMGFFAVLDGGSLNEALRKLSILEAVSPYVPPIPGIMQKLEKGIGQDHPREWEANTERWRLTGTGYSYDKNGDVFCCHPTKKGGFLKLIPKISVLHSLTHELRSTDCLFEEVSGRQYWVFRLSEAEHKQEWKPCYLIDAQGSVIQRFTDGMVAALKPNQPILEWKAVTTQDSKPAGIWRAECPGTWRRTSDNHLMSVEEAGYCLVQEDKRPNLICGGYNLSDNLPQGTRFLQKKDDPNKAATVFYVPYKDEEDKETRFVKFYFNNGKIETSDPWSLLELLGVLILRSPELIKVVMPILRQLNPPEDEIQRSILQKMQGLLENKEFVQNEPYTALVLCYLESTLAGGQPAWSKKTALEGWNMYLNVKQLEVYGVHLPKDVEMHFLYLLQLLMQQEEEEARHAEGKWLERKEALLSARLGHRLLIRPYIEARLEQLGKGRVPEVGYQKIAAVGRFREIVLFRNNLDAMSKGVDTLRTLSEQIGAYEKAEGTDELPAWADIKNNPESLKNDLYLYHVAVSGTPAERKDLIEYLTLVGERGPKTQLLIEVARHPRRFLTLKKLKAQAQAEAKARSEITKKIVESSVEKWAFNTKSVEAGQKIHENHWVHKKWKIHVGKKTLSPSYIKPQVHYLHNSIYRVQKMYYLCRKMVAQIQEGVHGLRQQYAKTVSALPHRFILSAIVGTGVSMLSDTISAVVGTFAPVFISLNRSVHTRVERPIRTYTVYKPLVTTRGELKVADEQDTALMTTIQEMDLQDGKVDARVIQSCKQYIQTLQVQLLQKRAELLELANGVREEGKDADVRLRKLAHMGKDYVDFDQLQKLVLKQQAYAYNKHLVHPENASRIEEQMYVYMVIATRLGQLKRMKSAAEALQAVPEADPRRAELVGAWETQLKQKRAYSLQDPHERLLLFMDYASPKGFITEAQYAQIQKLRKHNQPVQLSQMPTGFGKTDYIIPVLNAYLSPPTASGGALAKEEKKATPIAGVEGRKIGKTPAVRYASHVRKLVWNLWPDGIVKLNEGAIRRKTEQAFTKEVRRLSFARTSRKSPVSLNKLASDFEQAQRKGIALSVRGSDVDALFLRLQEVLAFLASEAALSSADTPHQKEMAAALMRILSVLLTSSAITLDEAHETTDPKQQTIFTLNRSVPPPPYAADFACDIFFALARTAAFALLQARIDAGQQITAEDSEACVEAAVKERSFLEQAAEKIGVTVEQLQAFEKTGALPSGLSPVKQSQLFLWLGYKKVLLKTALTGNVGVRFGLSHLHPEIQFVIPYEKKDQPKERKDSPQPSQYKNLDETLLKTVRFYHTTGLNRHHCEQLFHKLYDEYKAVYRDYNEREMLNELSNTSAYKILDGLFQEIRKPDWFDALKNPQFNASTIEDWFADISVVEKASKNPACIKAFIGHCVLTQMQLFPQSVVITPQDRINFFPQSVGVSATPHPSVTHGHKALFSSVPGAAEKPKEWLETKAIAKVQCRDFSDIDVFARELSDAAKHRGVRAVIDPSAQLPGSGYQVACAMAAAIKEVSGHPITSILYFNKDAQCLYKMDVATGATFLFKDDASHDPEHCFVICDHARSTGLDVRHVLHAVGIVLIGKGTTLDEAAQAAGRMRQLKLEEGHKLMYWTNETNLDGKTPQELTAFLETNQKSAFKERNQAAFAQHMDSTLRVAMFKDILDVPVDMRGDATKAVTFAREPNVDRAVERFRQFSTFLISSQPYNPEAAYKGLIKDPVSGSEALQQHKKVVLDKAHAYFNIISHRETRKYIQERLNGYEKVWTSVDLSDNVYPVSGGGEQEIEAQQNIEQEQEQHKDVAIERETDQLDYQQEHVWDTEYNWPDSVLNINFAREAQKVRTLYGRLSRWHAVREQIAHVPRGGSGGYIGGLSKLLKIRLLGVKERWARLRAEAAVGGAIRTANSVQFLPVREVIAAELAEAKAGQLFFAPGAELFFSENFYVTNNICDSLRKDRAHLLEPDGNKFLNHILLVQDKVPTPDGGSTWKYSAIAIDTKDKADIEARLSKEPPNPNRKVAVYQLDIRGVAYQRSDAQWTQDELASDEVRSLIVQAQVLAGKEGSYYGASEKDPLKQRISHIQGKDFFKKRAVFETIVDRLTKKIERPKKYTWIVSLLGVDDQAAS